MDTMTSIKLQDSAMRLIAWIEAVLSNDEGSTDEQLVQHFMVEGNLSERTARRWVAKRTAYLNGQEG